MGSSSSRPSRRQEQQQPQGQYRSPYTQQVAPHAQQYYGQPGAPGSQRQEQIGGPYPNFYMYYMQPVQHASQTPASGNGGPAAEPPRMQQTQKIKNLVNLHKSSLKLVPFAEDPNKLKVEFTFDSSAPCTVTTLVLAGEVNKQGLLDANPGGCKPGPRVAFPEGLGHKFASAQHFVDMSKCDHDVMASAEGDLYPLVIRLEALTQAARDQGKTLDDLAIGSEQPAWVQSQTTYAVVTRTEAGQWVAKVIKQKIMFDGTPYELQEIYGLQAAAANGGTAEGTPIAEDPDDGSTECIICMSQARDTAVLPCRHMCMCKECAQALISPTNTSSTRAKCPICRRMVSNILTIVKTENGGTMQQAQPVRGPAAV
ncbi:unnamed protein product [Pedinophyceae sp. YPF-701]|nr:unnamed protein product [Pedinophyceae sp. YPF-701]